MIFLLTMFENGQLRFSKHSDGDAAFEYICDNDSDEISDAITRSLTSRDHYKKYVSDKFSKSEGIYHVEGIRYTVLQSGKADKITDIINFFKEVNENVLGLENSESEIYGRIP